ncbi:hypothetical protein PJV97_09635 [Aliarcobacter butzleri]|uniref:plasmid mobilization protein n=1 Tax=Aliarcobacter butzleri TaxID=28197 RepID=UPI0021B3DE46|nr:hypothetical protein [Aliarcobacter butzleri]MCT7618377.1 hypothetical protein [Aliarcobacter butzleri]MDN5112605.1 hypothetical protein [Aliarcobacter butzleri]
MKESIFKKNEKKSFAFVEDKSLENGVKELDDFVSSARGETKKVLNPKGRPKLEQDELKQEQIVIYLTKEQKDEITKKAKQSSLSVSKYVMLKVFGIS